jgi:hypothetical protein
LDNEGSWAVRIFLQEKDVDLRNIEQNKTKRHSFCANSKQSSVFQKIVHHPAQQHVVESVDPQRSEEDQDELWIVCSLRCGILDTNAANNEGCRFPYCSHYQSPAKGFAKLVGLEDVDGCSNAEQNGEEDGCWERRTIRPHIVRIVDGCVKLVDKMLFGAVKTYEDILSF